MKKLKVMTIVGTRPEIIRLSRVMSLLEEHCDHILVHTGQNYDYELNQIFFDDLGIKEPDHFLNCAKSSSSAAHTIGNLITAVDQLLDKTKPEALLVLGDTNSCLSVIPAKRRKVPIFHMEAGNRCFDQRVPEEINRKIVDHTADINMPYSSIAREYLIREGLPPDQIVKIGSPMLEVLKYYAPQIENASSLDVLEVRPTEYFLVSAHREENIDSDKHLHSLFEILNGLAKTYNFPILVSTHPRTRNRVEKKNIVYNSLIRLLKPLGFFDYVKLQINARAVLSDSGTINEESSILNFPALNLREAHERPEAMEEASVMMVGLDKVRILQGLEILQKQKRDHVRTLHLVQDYSTPNVSEKVLRIIQSYTDYVNRVVWKKY
jgi:UDP-N-acetylglucosamine 2-epimerase